MAQPLLWHCRTLAVTLALTLLRRCRRRPVPQLSILARTNIMMAVHGAGVFNLLWLPPRSGTVIELMHNAAGNYHYHNAANFLGLQYISGPGTQSVDQVGGGRGCTGACCS